MTLIRIKTIKYPDGIITDRDGLELLPTMETHARNVVPNGLYDFIKFENPDLKPKEIMSVALSQVFEILGDYGLLISQMEEGNYEDIKHRVESILSGNF